MYTNLLYVVMLAASSLSASVIQDVGDSCREDQWKCDDGSCISVDGKWNSIINCHHSSVPPRTSHRKTRQAQKEICVLPEYPANGEYSTHIPNAKPADVYELVTVNVTCARGFELVGAAATYCYKGAWSKPMPTCVPQCYLPSDPSVVYRCIVFGEVESSRACEEYESNGTVVSPQCRSPYYASAVVLTNMQCIDGNWNYTVKCSPECGEVSSIGKPLLVDGVSAERAEVPWHAGVYTTSTRPYKQICGGSLISDNIVLSAAHCFWSSSRSKQQPAADFAVAVGKLYRPWNDHKDADKAQRSNVTAIYWPPLFLGSAANYQEDIAVVVVTTPFRFTAFVRPVCVDFDISFQNTQLKLGNLGKVAGWGLTDVNGPPSQVLKVVELPVVATDTCVRDAPPDFREYITGDKICAGFKNEHRGVCKGDSGGGLAFPEWRSAQNGGTPRFYLRGIVSTAPTSRELCNVNFYTTFTQIMRHEDFIKQFWENGEPCQLKPHPSVEYRCLSYGKVESYWTCTAVSPRCRSPGYYSATALGLMNCVDGDWNYIAKCSQELPCLEESLKRYDRDSPFYSMDNKTLKHVALQRDSAGRLTHFQMHVAVEADEVMLIRLFDTSDSSVSQIRYYIFIGFDKNQYTNLDTPGTTVVHIHTPDVLSPSQFRRFYVQIRDGKLEFGKEGDSRPIISYRDANVGSVNYFGFGYGGHYGGRIRFDCPAPASDPV